MKGGNTRRNHRREQIIDSAAELFANLNFHQVLMDDVARRANLAKGTIYNYFKTKEELYLAIISDRLQHLLEILQRRVDTRNDSLTNLRRMIVHLYSFFAKYSHFFDIWYREKARLDLKGESQIARQYQELRRLFVAVLQKGISDGILIEHDSDFVADLIMGLIDAAVLRSKYFTPQQQRQERIQVFEFVLNAIGTPRALELHAMGVDDPEYAGSQDER